MKEITRIHLAGTPYNIELPAKKELEKYIGGITTALSADEDALREIEVRMIELLAERGVRGEQVITTADVAALRTRLGSPGEFAEAGDESTTTAKRLLRDEQHGMLGGVLAGMAAYTGVDVVWWRVAAVVLALMSFGTVLLVYVVLWIAMPPARTATERLQMRGRATTLENIQAETDSETSGTPTHKKPFVVLLRVLAVVSLVGTAIGAFTLTAFVVVASVPLFGTADWMLNGWLIAALITGVLSGLLLVALMVVGSYMVTAWRASRAALVSGGVIIAAGLLLFGASLGLFGYGAQQTQTVVANHTTTHREDLTQLAGAATVRVAETTTPVTYKVTDSAPYAEVTTFRRDTTKRLPVSVERNGTDAVLTVGSLPGNSCDSWLIGCRMEYSQVTIYGPALSTFSASNTTVAYETHGSQPQLTVALRDGAKLRLAGNVTRLDATVEKATLTADSAAIDEVTLNAKAGASTWLGVVRSLDVSSPESCGTDTKSSVMYERAAQVHINGTLSEAGTNCLELERTASDDA